MRKVAFSVLVFFACFACYQSFTGNPVGTPGGDRGMVRPLLGGDSQCVVLGGSGYLPSTCSGDDGRPIEGAVSAGQVVPAGEFGGKGHGAVLSMAEVEALWVQHGGDPAQAHTAAGVATAESGRRPLAVNGSNSDGSIDRGLFQMNSIHGGCSTFDLAENVRCAAQLQRSGGWGHWVAYKSGAFRRYL